MDTIGMLISKAPRHIHNKLSLNQDSNNLHLSTVSSENKKKKLKRRRFCLKYPPPSHYEIMQKKTSKYCLVKQFSQEKLI